MRPSAHVGCETLCQADLKGKGRLNAAGCQSYLQVMRRPAYGGPTGWDNPVEAVRPSPVGPSCLVTTTSTTPSPDLCEILEGLLGNKKEAVRAAGNLLGNGVPAPKSYCCREFQDEPRFAHARHMQAEIAPAEVEMT
jgi:hypothetical protein